MNRPPAHFDPRKHPFWKSYPDCPQQFIDPILKRSIGFWDTSHSLPFFYDLGYCKKNPNDEFDCGFTFDPKEQMFKEKEGNRI